MDIETLRPDGYHAPNDPQNYYRTIPSPETLADQRIRSVETATRNLALSSGALFLGSWALGLETPMIVTGGTTIGLVSATAVVKSTRKLLFRPDSDTN
ncbi:MAG TPA: hypothetical protein PKB09_03585 [Candidatus Saccharibacteria bacterium]|nr:hypothetical protein [Candidatus Saccharibacteria bacterium]